MTKQTYVIYDVSISFFLAHLGSLGSANPKKAGTYPRIVIGYVCRLKSNCLYTTKIWMGFT